MGVSDATSRETVRLAVKVTPRCVRDEIIGWDTHAHGELRVHVCAPPEGGKANKALCKLIAKALGIPKTTVTVVRGDTARHKLLEFTVDKEAYEAWGRGLPVCASGDDPGTPYGDDPVGR